MTFCILVVVFAPSISRNDDEKALRNIGEVYEANRAAFPFATIKFRSSVGTAASYEDAKSGRWNTRYDQYAFCAYDNKQARYEVVYPLGEMVARRKKGRQGRWLSPISSVRTLTDGTSSLVETVFPNDAGDALKRSALISRVRGAGGRCRKYPCPSNLADETRVRSSFADITGAGKKAESPDVYNVTLTTTSSGRALPRIRWKRWFGNRRIVQGQVKQSKGCIGSTWRGMVAFPSRNASISSPGLEI